jgi:hypothetical protein
MLCINCKLNTNIVLAVKQGVWTERGYLWETNLKFMGDKFMKISDELIDLKGGVQNAVEYLNRRGVKVTVGRYNQWLSGRFHPKYETISIILEEITDFTLSPSSVQHSDENIVLKRTIPVTELRQKLPHRRFANNYWQRVRYVDSQILEAVHGHDVWTRFEAMCGNFECARYVLRRNLNEHTVTDSWIQNGLRRGWIPECVNVMVDLLEKYEGTGTQFNVMVCEPPVTRVEPPVTRVEPPVTRVEPPVTRVEPPVTRVEPSVARVEAPVARVEAPVVDVSDLKEKIRLYALSHNPHCDVDNMPDDVVLMMYKDMMGQ